MLSQCSPTIGPLILLLFDENEMKGAGDRVLPYAFVFFGVVDFVLLHRLPLGGKFI
jgi:hypothetical protein